MSTTPADVGRNIATVRKARGLSQRQLADRLHVSKSLLEKVERGARTATPALVASIARTVGCTPADLTGQPAARGPVTQDERARAALDEIRRAVACYDVAPDLEAPGRPLAQLRHETRRVRRLRHDARLTALGNLVPGLIAELTALVHRSDGDERAESFALLVDAYSAANQVAYKFGYDDLSNLLVERIRWAANQAADPLVGNVSDWMHAGMLRVHGHHDRAFSILGRALAGFDDVGRLDPRQLSMYGSLHLQAAMVAADSRKRDLVRDHLREADDAAGLLRVDTNYFDLSFGSSNVTIYRVATAVALWDGTLAVSESRKARLSTTVPKERAAYYQLDVARGWLLHGDEQRALHSLLSAERIAPEQTRAHPEVRHAVRELLDVEKRRTETLAGLARRVHLTP
jgi:transcriptional regulator with XRE-family HTH domain